MGRTNCLQGHLQDLLQQQHEVWVKLVKMDCSLQKF